MIAAMQAAYKPGGYITPDMLAAMRAGYPVTQAMVIAMHQTLHSNGQVTGEMVGTANATIRQLQTSYAWQCQRAWVNAALGTSG